MPERGNYKAAAGLQPGESRLARNAGPQFEDHLPQQIDLAPRDQFGGCLAIERVVRFRQPSADGTPRDDPAQPAQEALQFGSVDLKTVRPIAPARETSPESRLKWRSKSG
jgi:hypothetical protein